MAKTELQQKAKKGTDDSKKDDNTPTISSSKNSAEKKTPLYDLFLSGLKDILYAENKLVDALQEMEQAATTEELKDAFEDHYLLTKKHVSRLKKIFERLGENEESKECKAMDGLIEEAREIIKSTQEGSVTRDVALIIAAQKVEHYEIATYGGLAQIAITLGLDKVADILEKTLQEEEETDETLTDIAESHINPEAEKED
ncbi:ferritin-like domain-containing protein [Sphingobacterium sp.]|uniref:ferritin-like domain-containing protein n=1 Tax=Sphingobacterium sp. TaxID=341027 RepID=UPI0028AFA9AE|nr:ferritin-like domain-containing protein [Sphingobacterium sp.]